MEGGSWREGPRRETGEEDRMLRRGASMKIEEGCGFWEVVGGLQVIYPEGDLHFPKGDYTHELCACLKPLVLAGCLASRLSMGKSHRGVKLCAEGCQRALTEGEQFKQDNWIFLQICQFPSETEVGMGVPMQLAVFQKGSEEACLVLGQAQGGRKSCSQTNVCKSRIWLLLKLNTCACVYKDGTLKKRTEEQHGKNQIRRAKMNKEEVDLFRKHRTGWRR